MARFSWGKTTRRRLGALAAALLATGAQARGGGPAQSAAQASAETAAAPGPFDGPAPRADGWWVVGLVGGVQSDGPGIGLRLGLGRPVTERLRLDLALTSTRFRGSLPPPGGPVAGVTTIEERKLDRSLALLEVVATWRFGRLEAWGGVGLANSGADAEVRGPTTTVCSIILGCGPSTPSADDGGNRAGPAGSVGVNLILDTHFLASLEAHVPLTGPVDLRKFSISLTQPSPVVMATFTLRGGEPPRRASEAPRPVEPPEPAPPGSTWEPGP